MIPKMSFPIVVMGVNIGGALEHPALINRVWDDGDTIHGPVCVDATMFPSGGGDPQFQRHLYLYDTKALAEAGPPTHRKAYYAVNS